MLIHPSDTLVIDSAKLQVWWKDDDFNYDREIMPSQTSVMDWLNHKLDQMMNDLFGSHFFQEHVWNVWVIVGIVALLALLAILFYRHPAFFFRSGKVRQMDYQVTEDTIYGIDFLAEIESSRSKKDYREMVRLMYLQTLKSLSDCQQIEWQAFKTPTQYTYEFSHVGFRKLTQLFMRVRYGGFVANEQVVDEMHSYQQSVDNILKQLSDSKKQEGGRR